MKYDGGIVRACSRLAGIGLVINRDTLILCHGVFFIRFVCGLVACLEAIILSFFVFPFPGVINTIFPVSY